MDFCLTQGSQKSKKRSQKMIMKRQAAKLKTDINKDKEFKIRIYMSCFLTVITERKKKKLPVEKYTKYLDKKFRES